jgi:hypothetical protein
MKPRDVCDFCTKEIHVPILFPCNKQVCKKHLRCNKLAPDNKYKCPFCAEYHFVRKESFSQEETSAFTLADQIIQKHDTKAFRERILMTSKRNTELSNIAEAMLNTPDHIIAVYLKRLHQKLNKQQTKIEHILDQEYTAFDVFLANLRNFSLKNISVIRTYARIFDIKNFLQKLKNYERELKNKSLTDDQINALYIQIKNDVKSVETLRKNIYKCILNNQTWVNDSRFRDKNLFMNKLREFSRHFLLDPSRERAVFKHVLNNAQDLRRQHGIFESEEACVVRNKTWSVVTRFRADDDQMQIYLKEVEDEKNILTTNYSTIITAELYILNKKNPRKNLVLRMENVEFNKSDGAWSFQELLDANLMFNEQNGFYDVKSDSFTYILSLHLSPLFLKSKKNF